MYELEHISKALAASWSYDTAYPDDTWSAQSPARSQCVGTALVVQHFLGGELEKLTTIYNNQPELHYRNILPDGQIIDLTCAQYPPNQQLSQSTVNLHGFSSAREKMLSEPDTRIRYELLLRKVVAYLEGHRTESISHMIKKSPN